MVALLVKRESMKRSHDKLKINNAVPIYWDFSATENNGSNNDCDRNSNICNGSTAQIRFDSVFRKSSVNIHFTRLHIYPAVTTRFLYPESPKSAQHLLITKVDRFAAISLNWRFTDTYSCTINLLSISYWWNSTCDSWSCKRIYSFYHLDLLCEAAKELYCSTREDLHWCL